MSLTGDLETVYLFSILQLLCSDKKTGALRVWSGGQEAKIYLNEGTVFYTTGSEKKFRLGYLLRTSGMISAEDTQKCLTIARQQKQTLGKVMVDEGYVSIQQLTDFMQEKVQETFYDLFRWKSGNFEFSRTRFNLAGYFIAEINTMELIMEASKRVSKQAAREEDGVEADHKEIMPGKDTIEFASIGVPNISPEDDE